MSNNNYNTPLNVGGGNPLNIIRIPSSNEVSTIFSSDLNGSITPGNSNTWQYDIYEVMMYQNNTNGLAYMTKSSMSSFYDKSAVLLNIHKYWSISFNTVIEFKE